MSAAPIVARYRSAMPAAADELYRWHIRPGAFERLLPPWETVRVLRRDGPIADGSRITLKVPLGPLRLRWALEHRGVEAGRAFRDVQIAGPFSLWEHTHHFETAGSGSSTLEDSIVYGLPGGPLGRWLGGRLVRRALDRLFGYRHRVTFDDLVQHHARPAGAPLNILVTGSSGLVGSALVPFLTTGGHRVIRLLRREAAGDVRGLPDPGTALWEPASGRIEAPALDGLDAVVHLAGDGIAAGRWTERKKARIRDSRVAPTRLLCETLARLARPPRVLVSASAIGFYGDRGEALLDEDSGPGAGFLPEVCRDWEAATTALERAGTRVVHLRFGIILGAGGGALKRMLRPFRLGLGGRLGSGRQFMSWIAIDDAIGAVHQALTDGTLRGPVNAVAPRPVTNREFSRVLGRVLSRPAIAPLPAPAARLAFGEMADALLLSSARVAPARLLAAGYRFRHADLEGALRHQLGRRVR